MEAPARKILLAGKNPENLRLMAELLSGQFQVTTCTLEELPQALTKAGDVLAVLDSSGAPSEVWEACRTIKAAGLPLLLIASREIARETRRATEIGVDDIVVKPVSKPVLISRLTRASERLLPSKG